MKLVFKKVEVFICMRMRARAHTHTHTHTHTHSAAPKIVLPTFSPCIFHVKTK